MENTSVTSEHGKHEQHNTVAGVGGGKLSALFGVLCAAVFGVRLSNHAAFLSLLCHATQTWPTNMTHWSIPAQMIEPMARASRPPVFDSAFHRPTRTKSLTKSFVPRTTLRRTYVSAGWAGEAASCQKSATIVSKPPSQTKSSAQLAIRRSTQGYCGSAAATRNNKTDEPHPQIKSWPCRKRRQAAVWIGTQR